MPRDDNRPSREPDRQHDGPSSEGARRLPQRAGAVSSPRRGRSGYGMESIRPHLRAQLDYEKLWRPTFPPEDDEPEGEGR